MSLTRSTVVHSFQNADGSPAVGEVQLTLTKGLTNGTQTVVPMSLSADLVDGALSQDLVSNLDANTNPGDSHWRVDLRLNGMQPLTYFIQVPSGTAVAPYPTVDLGALLPTDGLTVPVDIVTTWQPYLDVQRDVKNYLQITPGNNKYDQPLADITAAICEAVQTYLGQPVPPTQFSRRFSGNTGWEGSHIMLPYRPVIGTPSITETWGGSGPHALDEQTPSHQHNTLPNANFGDMYQLDRLTGLITRTFPGLVSRSFFPGERNIEITWVAGYNPIPAQLKLATLEWIDTWYRSTQEAVRTSRLPTEYGNEQPMLWKTMPNHVAQLLQPFTHVGIA